MRKSTIVFLVFFIFLIFFTTYFFLIIPAKKLKIKAGEINKKIREIKEVFKENDLDKLEKKIGELEKEYSQFGSLAGKLYWISFLPVVGGYGRDLKNAVEAGEALIKSGKEAVHTISPYADLIGFKKGKSSFVEKPADERIQMAVLTLDKMLVNIDRISFYIDEAYKKVNQIEEKRYPKKIKNFAIQEKIIQFKNEVNALASFFVDAKPFLKKLPSILGKDQSKTYLVLFQNDKELRATGGFLTAFSVFKVKNGKFQVLLSEDIYTLDNSISQHPQAPLPILTYHKGVNRFYIRDSNLSPDFVESIRLFENLYQKSSQKVDYDGIIAVDTKVLVDALEILKDTEVNGIWFSSRIDKRCDCPQVIYTLFDIIDRPVPYLKENRKGILGDLLYVLMEKALGFSPSQYWGRIAQMLIKNLQEKHILIYLTDKEAQKAIEKINFAGRIRSYDGDYLHINDVNFAGQKSNLFVKHQITSETKISSDGKIRRQLIIEYRNPYPHSDCNLERGNLCLNATLRNWLRIYVPQGSRLISFQGSETKVKTYNELGKTVFEGFLRVVPLGKTKVVVEYELPFKSSLKDYRLLIQKQPGTSGHLFTIKINGRVILDRFPLTSDYEVKIK